MTKQQSKQNAKEYRDFKAEEAKTRKTFRVVVEISVPKKTRMPSHLDVESCADLLDLHDLFRAEEHVKNVKVEVLS